ncbi:hypothetical protein LTR53_018031, partial [Teratosphaeriaceae sp. CCFEE 6253]
VYLEDGSLPLPEEEGGEGEAARVGGEEKEEEGWTEVDRGDVGLGLTPATAALRKPADSSAREAEVALADPASFEVDADSDRPTPKSSPRIPAITVNTLQSLALDAPQPPVQGSADRTPAPPSASPATEPPPPTAETPPLKPSPHRPALAESPYSFMLGDPSSAASPKPASRPPASTADSPFGSPPIHRRTGSKSAGLFGDEPRGGSKADGTGDGAGEDGDGDGDEDGVTVVRPAARRDKRGTGGSERIRGRGKRVVVGEAVEGGL